MSGSRIFAPNVDSSNMCGDILRMIMHLGFDRFSGLLLHAVGTKFNCVFEW